MNIVLIGMMGSGKSAVGKKVAERLRRAFYDIDALIEKEEGQTIAQIFAQKGEPAFRNLEKKMIEQATRNDGSVIATGGGAPCDKENWELLSRNGFIVWLKASPVKLLERIKKKSLSARPLLVDQRDPLQTITDLLKKREPFYAKAHQTIETDQSDRDETAEKIVMEFTKQK
ncbi:MAG: shikimate kinase [Elusimicrobia bacterium]|nr:shikimate kinase [Elusimicrobiota bacterium]